MGIEYTLPIRTYSTLNQREHWAKRHRRNVAERRAVALIVPNPLELDRHFPIVVTFTRIAPRRLDSGDNLAAAFKAIRDQLAEQIGIDDGDERVQWRYAQEKGRPKEYAARITIEEARHADC